VSGTKAREYTLANSSGTIERRVWLSLPREDVACGAILFLDGELYRERVRAQEVVDELVAHGTIPTVRCLYVSNAGASARHVDYTCSDAYAAFIAHDVAGWFDDQDAAACSGRIVLAGLSLSGLAVAHLAIQHPAPWRRVICQSPSFWWQDEAFRRRLSRAAPNTPPLWVCVGDAETSRGVAHPPTGLWQGETQLASCQRTGDDLTRLGYNVRFRTYAGGHDPVCWADDLRLALPWAFSAK
jgi:enterochelin esterase-like enzyme